MRVLLHICCAHCAVYPAQWLKDHGHEVRGVFFNPNIQPYQEFVLRREAVKGLSEAMRLPMIFMEDYPLEEFFRRMVFREGQRCRICYQWRLETVARLARRGKYEAWTTSLLSSKRQRHDWIHEIAQEEARARGVSFLYEDFRKGAEEGHRRSTGWGLYRQTYCGCVYSERDRFLPPHGRSRIK